MFLLYYYHYYILKERERGREREYYITLHIHTHIYRALELYIYVLSQHRHLPISTFNIQVPPQGPPQPLLFLVWRVGRGGGGLSSANVALTLGRAPGRARRRLRSSETSCSALRKTKNKISKVSALVYLPCTFKKVTVL